MSLCRSLHPAGGAPENCGSGVGRAGAAAGFRGRFVDGHPQTSTRIPLREHDSADGLGPGKWADRSHQGDLAQRQACRLAADSRQAGELPHRVDAADERGDRARRPPSRLASGNLPAGDSAAGRKALDHQLPRVGFCCPRRSRLLGGADSSESTTIAAPPAAGQSVGASQGHQASAAATAASAHQAGGFYARRTEKPLGVSNATDREGPSSNQRPRVGATPPLEAPCGAGRR